jgi:predicted protein tyrosine phosphatase
MFKPWIENISLGAVAKGEHYDAGENSMLIQIVDPGTEFPTPKFAFKEVRQFFFLDVEDDDYEKIYYAAAITDDDAAGLAEALKHAYANHMNVVVHCHMGVCRSGAVAEVGVMMGFQDTERFRAPNLMVKRKMLDYLGMTYDKDEKSIDNQTAYDMECAYSNKNFLK